MLTLGGFTSSASKWFLAKKSRTLFFSWGKKSAGTSSLEGKLLLVSFSSRFSENLLAFGIQSWRPPCFSSPKWCHNNPSISINKPKAGQALIPPWRFRFFLCAEIPLEKFHFKGEMSQGYCFLYLVTSIFQGQLLGILSCFILQYLSPKHTVRFERSLSGFHPTRSFVGGSSDETWIP